MVETWFFMLEMEHVLAAPQLREDVSLFNWIVLLQISGASSFEERSYCVWFWAECDPTDTPTVKKTAWWCSDTFYVFSWMHFCSCHPLLSLYIFFVSAWLWLGFSNNLKRIQDIIFIVSTDHSLLKFIMIFHMNEKIIASSFNLPKDCIMQVTHSATCWAVNAGHQPSAQDFIN